MKRFLLILLFSITTTTILFAQDEDDEGSDKIRNRMTEFIQKRLDLTKEESAKFTPIFHRYFKDWRQTLKDNREKRDRLELQHKVVELRLKYREEFRAAIGERKGDRVFQQQDIFIKELAEYRKNRRRRR